MIWAVPARRTPYTVTQPNGDTLTVRLVGDEAWHCHYLVSDDKKKDGKMVIQANNGWWYYARKSCRTYTDMRGQKRNRIVRTCKKVKGNR